MTTLKVRNETGAPLKVGATTIPRTAEADVPEKDLKTPDFAAALRAGSVTLVPVPHPAEEQIRLAREVLSGVLTASVQHVAAAKNRFEKSRAALVKLRDAYNKTRSEAEASMAAAKEAVPGWKGVRDAVRHFLVDTRKEPEGLKAAREKLKKSEDRIKELVTEDLETTNRTRERWFADRLAAEKDRDAAYEEVKALEAKAQVKDPVARQLDTLEETAKAMDALDKDTAIGKEMPPLRS